MTRAMTAGLGVCGWTLWGGILAVGCAGAADEPVRPRETRQALFDNDRAAYDFFRAKGLTNFQAAGVVGNLDQESGVDPTIHQFNGGPGRGIAQWSAGGRWDTAEGDNLAAFAAQQGKDVYDLQVQLDFIWFELTSFSWYGLEELRATTTLEAATQVFEDKFEGCVYANYPECALPRRVEFAQAVLDAFGDDPPPADGSAGDGSAGGDGVAVDPDDGGALPPAGDGHEGGDGAPESDGSADQGDAGPVPDAGTSAAGGSGCAVTARGETPWLAWLVLGVLGLFVRRRSA